MAMWPVQVPRGPSNHRRHVEETGKAPRLPVPPHLHVSTREERSFGSWRKADTASTITRWRSRQQAPSPELVRSSESEKFEKSREVRQKKTCDHEEPRPNTPRTSSRPASPPLKLKKSKKRRRETSHNHKETLLDAYQPAPRQSSPSRKLNKLKKLENLSSTSRSDKPRNSKKLKKHKKHQSSSSHSHGNTPLEPYPPAPHQPLSFLELKNPKKRRRKAAHETTMVIANSASRRSKTAPLTAKEKRNRTPKPQSRCVPITPNLALATKKRGDKTKQPKPLGPGTRPGSHQQLPITIDSDNESDVVELEISASAAICAYSMPTSPSNATSSTRTRHDRVQTARPFAKPPHLARIHDPTVYEERFVSVSVEPSTPTKARDGTSFLAAQRPQRAQNETTNCRPELAHTQTKPSISNVRLQSCLFGASPSPSPSYADDGIELTLADITDFNLRQKTADLMVVAPGLPVADLYHLLMERQGRFEETKQEVIRKSQGSSAKPPTQRPLSPARAATLPINMPSDVQEKHEDGPYIKFDFDDPSFIYDNDAPMEPFAEAGRPRRNSQVRPKKSAKILTTKSVKNNPYVGKASGPASQRTQSSSHTASRSPGTPTKPSVKIPTYPITPTRATKTRKGHIVKNLKGKGAGDINRSLRETSYDRGFVVPDEEILLDDSDTYSESDEADVDMTDDGTDLTIDMEPEYSYNSAILSSPMSR